MIFHLSLSARIKAWNSWHNLTRQTSNFQVAFSVECWYWRYLLYFNSFDIVNSSIILPPPLGARPSEYLVTFIFRLYSKESLHLGAPLLIGSSLEYWCCHWWSNEEKLKQMLLFFLSPIPQKAPGIFAITTRLTSFTLLTSIPSLTGFTIFTMLFTCVTSFWKLIWMFDQFAERGIAGDRKQSEK